MNISSLMRSMVGAVQPAEGKQLELKPGQIVKGKVLQTGPDSEALMNINGALVKAKLETPLEQGQTTLLQVQPESADGQVVLKPVGSSTAVPIAEDSIADVVKTLGLQGMKPGQGEAIVRLLHKEGLPLTKESAEALKLLIQQIPEGTDEGEWLKAATVAMKRGLPVTAETVASLRQVMFGKPLAGTLQDLQSALNQLGSQGIKLSPETTQLLQKLTALAGEILGEGEAAVAVPAKQVLGKLGAAETAGSRNLAGDTKPGPGQGGTAVPAGRDIPVRSSGAAGLDTGSAEPEHRAAASGSTADRVNTGGNKASNGITLPMQGYVSDDKGIHPEGNGTATLQKGDAGGGSSIYVTQAQGGELHDEAQVKNPAAGASTSGEAAAQQNVKVGQAEAAASGQAAKEQIAGTPKQGSQPYPGGNMPEQSGSVGDSKMNGTLPAVPGATGTDLRQNTADDSIAGGAQHSGAGSELEVQEKQSPSLNGNVSSGVTGTTVEENPWIAKVMKLLGIEHEHRVSRFVPMSQSGEGRAGLNSAMQQEILLTGNASAQQGTSAASGETVKSLLLQLSQSADLPSGVKDSLQQAIQQITGQQLLMSPDRNHVFSHVTLFIPFKNDQGEQTAAVHIQSRKGEKGELDKDNCRLLFDLHMKALGNTLLDVQVVNKIVTLKIHNDFPAVQELMEESRSDISDALEGFGYQFLSLKCAPYPVTGSSDDIGSSTDEAVLMQSAANYTAEPYKGMDLRI
ncbi:hypothetical protein [Paenibacillus gansuensis]|uniref:Flagellar hook-length control protein-like C-terminal domain-containing protein n=1 Tax=Paenibacillus gansuensis TaxID=306542 RepID=A0ABW5PF48_9BACL